MDRKRLIKFLFVLSIECIITSDKSVAVLFLRTHARAVNDVAVFALWVIHSILIRGSSHIFLLGNGDLLINISA